MQLELEGEVVLVAGQGLGVRLVLALRGKVERLAPPVLVEICMHASARQIVVIFRQHTGGKVVVGVHDLNTQSE